MESRSRGYYQRLTSKWSPDEEGTSTRLAPATSKQSEQETNNTRDSVNKQS